MGRALAVGCRLSSAPSPCTVAQGHCPPSPGVARPMLDPSALSLLVLMEGLRPSLGELLPQRALLRPPPLWARSKMLTCFHVRRHCPAPTGPRNGVQLGFSTWPTSATNPVCASELHTPPPSSKLEPRTGTPRGQQPAAANGGLEPSHQQCRRWLCQDWT